MSITKTIISHFYNEEYLLPWWLNHHKNSFDHGILIDYESTDNSVHIIKDICPHWKIVKSKNKDFDAKLVDQEVIEYEQNITGWRIALNITEFLVGQLNLDFKNTISQLLIPQISFFDWDPYGCLNKNQKLWEQKKIGIDYKSMFQLRRARSFHNIQNIKYPLGRHFETYNCENLLIFHYANCISSPEMINRRLQIQHRIPLKDKKLNLGFQHHNNGRGMTRYAIHSYNTSYSKFFQDHSAYIKKMFPD